MLSALLLRAALRVVVRLWVIGEGGVVTVPHGNWIEAVVEPVLLKLARITGFCSSSGISGEGGSSSFFMK